MNFYSTLDRLHTEVRRNRWIHYFSIFLRIALAFGFITSGFVKIAGERFASGLSVNHPMGQYLEALHNTGFYYTFIGWMQVTAALLLLFPATVLLGALIYLPVILNIFILSYAVRFEGSTLTSPLMVLGIVFLICWNYDKVKYILPGHPAVVPVKIPKQDLSNKFPWKFFAASFLTVSAVVLFILFGFDIMPRNSSRDCNAQFVGTNRKKAGAAFCDCIHGKGQPLNKSLDAYYQAPDDDASFPVRIK